MPVVLETVALEKHFGGIAAVAGVSLSIEKGADRAERRRKDDGH